VCALPSWNADSDPGLIMHTARETISNCSTRDLGLGEGRDTVQGSFMDRRLPHEPASPRPIITDGFCHSSCCEMSSVASSSSNRNVPILRDLEQHAYCPFLEDDAPLTRTQTPVSVSLLHDIGRSLPRGLLSTGLQEGKNVLRHKSRTFTASNGMPMNTMLSFFGEASVPFMKHGCRHLIETHHFVMQLQDSVAEEIGLEDAAAQLKHTLQQQLEVISVPEDNT
jgi:hypothetical protein